MAHETPLPEIERFLAETGMGVSYFGQKSVGNSKLVRRLRDGRPIETETLSKIRRFMADETKRRRDARRLLKSEPVPAPSLPEQARAAS